MWKQETKVGGLRTAVAPALLLLIVLLEWEKLPTEGSVSPKQESCLMKTLRARVCVCVCE